MTWILPPGVRALLPEHAESLHERALVAADNAHITNAFFDTRMSESFGFPPWILLPPDVPALLLLANERPAKPGQQNPFQMLAVQVARCGPGQHFACTPDNFIEPRSEYGCH